MRRTKATKKVRQQPMMIDDEQDETLVNSLLAKISVWLWEGLTIAILPTGYVMSHAILYLSVLAGSL